MNRCFVFLYEHNNENAARCFVITYIYIKTERICVTTQRACTSDISMNKRNVERKVTGEYLALNITSNTKYICEKIICSEYRVPTQYMEMLVKIELSLVLYHSQERYIMIMEMFERFLSISSVYLFLEIYIKKKNRRAIFRCYFTIC